MSDHFTWQAPGLPYQYGVTIRGDQAVWQWWSSPGLPPTEEAQPLAALAEGRQAIPSAWQQVPEPIWAELQQRATASLGTSPTTFAPALVAPVAGGPAGAPPAGWGPPAGSPPAWGAPAGPQQGFGAPMGPPAAGQGGPHGAPPPAPALGGPSPASEPAAAGADDPKAYVLTLLRAGEHARAVAYYQATFKVSAIMAREEVENLEQQLRR
ncbi:MAG: hypothetical protein KIT72_11360 [Polyangiaceae bacterium]|nr:hypothetical protein [Polyangiaceae bacterium]MCW5791010.1 hypothetical protein [Polyangiaceae bacterium]